MANIVDRYIKAYANELSKEGRKLILKAYNTANYKKDKTQNLHDSYGCAVYYNGKYVYGTKQFLNARAKVPRFNYYTGQKEYGFDEMNKYLDNYKPSTKGFELVVVAAMFYAEILEKGKGRLRRKYRVISGIDSDMSELAAKVGGRVIDINL